MKGKLDELTVEELNRSLREAKEELRKERFKRTVSRVENPKKTMQLKKQIARILTVLREYESGTRTARSK
ncbi:MAG TPA: 50S ribosomal protein L29 [Spirochaetota bacterium]|jgi:large subunit ribosomal protein L29|nr:50S ribosomal protein L29 [Spirochaetota bacterium]HOF13927.1 50S ribosomal protein L29 [Spirochaetota bacterium]HOM87483.1 50S ribosomal protein L29 [Spirochaetota bacterium]HOR93620.1 50S ribosomal protein L29 [Spirochaetota bacterium]HOT18874.1 50S ribosomal protein L29 [Spirochaetota bacterium]